MKGTTLNNQQPPPTPFDDQLGVKVLVAVELDRWDDLDTLFWSAQGELENVEFSAPHPEMERWFRYWVRDIKTLATEALEGTVAEVIDGESNGWIPFRVRRRGDAGEGDPLRLVDVESEGSWLVDVSHTRDCLIDIVNAADPEFVPAPPGPPDPYPDDF